MEIILYGSTISSSNMVLKVSYNVQNFGDHMKALISALLNKKVYLPKLTHLTIASIIRNPF